MIRGAVLLALLAAVLGLASLSLPWRFIDDEWDFRVADAMSASSGAEFFAVGVRTRDLPSRRWMPGFHLLKWARLRVLGRDVRAHKAARVLTLFLLALWVRSVVARAGGSARAALAAGVIVLAFPTQLECYFALSPPETELALLFAIFCESALHWTRPGASVGWLVTAAMALLAMVSIKETCCCIALPLAVLTWLCRGTPEPRLTRGLIALWLLLAGYVLVIAGALRWLAVPTVGVDYEARTMGASVAHLCGRLWWKSALLFPLAALGFATLSLRRPTPGAWPAALAIAMGAAAVLIILPWPVREIRYLALALPGLAVFVALGLERLLARWPWRGLSVAGAASAGALVLAWLVRDGGLAGTPAGRAALALAALLIVVAGLRLRDAGALAGAAVALAVGGSALWTAAQLAVDVPARIALHHRQDRCVWDVTQVLGARCPRNTTIAHVCPDARWRGWTDVIQQQLTAFPKRPDLTVVQVEPRELSSRFAWLVVAERDGATWPDADRWAAEHGYREVFSIDGSSFERALGDPRGVARQLALRVVHAAGLGPPDPRPLRDGFAMRWTWRVLSSERP